MQRSRIGLGRLPRTSWDRERTWGRQESPAWALRAGRCRRGGKWLIGGRGGSFDGVGESLSLSPCGFGEGGRGGVLPDKGAVRVEDGEEGGRGGDGVVGCLL